MSSQPRQAGGPFLSLRVARLCALTGVARYLRAVLERARAGEHRGRCSVRRRTVAVGAVAVIAIIVVVTVASEQTGGGDALAQRGLGSRNVRLCARTQRHGRGRLLCRRLRRE